MKKLIALMLTLCMVFTCSMAMASTFDSLQQMLRGGDANATEAPTAAPEATAAPETPAASAETDTVVGDCADGLTFVQGNVIAKTDDNSSYIDCYVYAEIRNDGDKNIALDGGIVVADAEGNVLDEQSYLFPYPSALAPGETAYVMESLMFEKTDAVTKAEQIASVKVSVHADEYTSDPELPVYTACEVSYGPGVNAYGMEVDGLTSFTVTNNTGADLKNPRVIAALYDTEGKMIYVTSELVGSFNTLRIPDGGSFMLDCEEFYFVSDWMEANGIVPGSIQCLAFGE